MAQHPRIPIIRKQKKCSKDYFLKHIIPAIQAKYPEAQYFKQQTQIYQILDELKNQYINQQLLNIMVEKCLIPAMEWANKKTQNLQHIFYVPTKHQILYGIDLSSIYFRFINQVNLQNKSANQILQFLIQSQKNQQRFQNLKFDLSQQQLRLVCQKVEQLYKLKSYSMFYIFAYIHISFQKLLKQNKKNQKQIQNKLKQIIKKLKQQYPAGQKVKNFLNNFIIEYDPINQIYNKNFFQNITNQDQKKQILYQLINNQIRQAQQKKPKFKQVIQKILQNKGYDLQINTKVQFGTSKFEINRYRVVQKILNMEQNKIGVNIPQEVLANIKQENQLLQIYLSNPNFKLIKYKISDMLRGRCSFPSVEKLYQFCRQLQQLNKNNKLEGIKIQQFQDRVTGKKKHTQDYVLKFYIDGLTAQLQLSVEGIKVKKQINHIFYEICRTEKSLMQFSSDQYSTYGIIFFQYHYNVIKQQTRESKNKYSQALDNFFNFCKQFEVKPIVIQEQQVRLKSGLISNIENLIKNKKNTLQARQSFKLWTKGSHYMTIQNYKVARKYLEQSLQLRLLQQNYQDIVQSYRSIGQIQKIEQNYQKALQAFNQALKICQQQKFYQQQKLVLIQIGICECKLNKKQGLSRLISCIQLFDKQSVDLQQKRQLQDLNQTISQYQKYFGGPINYDRQLQILFSLKQKEQKLSQKAKFCYNIGNIYQELKQYTQALIIFKQCLEYKKKIYEQSNKDLNFIRSKLRQIYKKVKKYDLALQQNKQCIKIATSNQNKYHYLQIQKSILNLKLIQLIQSQENIQKIIITNEQICDNLFQIIQIQHQQNQQNCRQSIFQYIKIVQINYNRSQQIFKVIKILKKTLQNMKQNSVINTIITICNAIIVAKNMFGMSYYLGLIKQIQQYVIKLKL